MPVPIRPQITDFIGSLSSRINDGLREVSSSIRSFGNSCNDRLQRLSGQQSSSGNSTNPENPIIDSNENDTQSPNVAPDAQSKKSFLIRLRTDFLCLLVKKSFDNRSF